MYSSGSNKHTKHSSQNDRLFLGISSTLSSAHISVTHSFTSALSQTGDGSIASTNNNKCNKNNMSANSNSNKSNTKLKKKKETSDRVER